MAQRRLIFVRIIALLVLALLSVIGPSQSFAQSSPQAQVEPQITALEAIVVQYPSGRILYRKADHDRMPPASLTKILTAILAIEYGKLDDVITVAPEDLAGESTMGLVVGEQQTLHNLLYGMMLPSGNDAAMSIARYLGSHLATSEHPDGDPIVRFADMMNSRISQLGLTDTHFVTPHGLDTPNHYSTAYDLASLTWYALHLQTFNEIVRSVKYDAPGHSLLNTNEMLTRYEGADGVKTGWTDGCGLCLVTTATRGGHRLISIVLNSPKWYSDSTALLDYGFSVLAATPVDTNAEVLSISKRDTVAWLIANPEVAPPVADAPALAQGGGQARDSTSKPALAPAVNAASSSSESAVDQTLISPVVGAGKADAAVLPAIVVFGIIALICCFLLVRHRRFAPAFDRPAGIVLRLLIFSRKKGDRPAGDASATARPARAHVRNWGGLAGSTSSEPRIMPVLAARRREPNILIALEDEPLRHLERAIALSAEGRQGSGMSEFVMALRAGAAIDIADLAEQYRLSAGAFLALARAQVAVGQQADARRTLLHGVLVMPGERVLRLALYQLPAES
jgi:D-alanyl-D-alanine carboxypeptidase